MGESSFAGAEGATAPETLRQMYRQERGLWRECACIVERITEEVSRNSSGVIFQVPGQRGHLFNTLAILAKVRKGACI